MAISHEKCFPRLFRLLFNCVNYTNYSYGNKTISAKNMIYNSCSRQIEIEHKKKTTTSLLPKKIEKCWRLRVSFSPFYLACIIIQYILHRVHIWPHTQKKIMPKIKSDIPEGLSLSKKKKCWWSTFKSINIDCAARIRFRTVHNIKLHIFELLAAEKWNERKNNALIKEGGRTEQQQKVKQQQQSEGSQHRREKENCICVWLTVLIHYYTILVCDKRICNAVFIQ